MKLKLIELVMVWMWDVRKRDVKVDLWVSYSNDVLNSGGIY